MKINTLRAGFLNLLLCIAGTLSQAQISHEIMGKVTDENKKPVVFANIVLREQSDSSLVGGTISNKEGFFSFVVPDSGTFRLVVSFVGYSPVHRTVHAQEGNAVDLGEICLEKDQAVLDEVVIRKNRIREKQLVDRSTYYVNKNMYSASQTGTDIVKMIPGINVDLFNQISIEGSQKVIIQVNGMERDAAYLGQLDSDKIDRIEILTSGGVQYGADVAGVINVILKAEKSGIQGHVYANVPTKPDEVFSFPSASLYYSRGETTWYTSYSGGFSYFNIEGNSQKISGNPDQPAEIIMQDRLRQENWSQKLHFGSDLLNNNKNQLNLYGFISNFSNEQDGLSRISLTGSVPDNETLNIERDDSDNNRSAYGSFYYRDQLNSASSLVAEGNYYILRSMSSTRLSDTESGIQKIAESEPGKNKLGFRMQFRSSINENLVFESGLKQQISHLYDHAYPGFRYKERILSGHAQMTYSGKKILAYGGLRAAHTFSAYEGINDKRRFAIIPGMSLQYNIDQSNNLKISYNKRLLRPDIYQLNPNATMTDPYTLRKGNPQLEPEVMHQLSASYGLSFRENYISAGLFYRRKSDVIEYLSTVNDPESYLREKQNLGNLYQTGVKFSGSMNLLKSISLSPHAEIYHSRSHGNKLARSRGITDNTSMIIKTKISAIWKIQEDFSLSASLQYQSPIRGIQQEYHEGTLYFLSLEKTFFEKLNIGITSAIPFMRSFTYQGYKISGTDFREETEDNIIVSMVPVWIKLKYSFARGQNISRPVQREAFWETRVKKGF